MADNSEIIVGGGQAIRPDQATIDELVEKLRQKLVARGMDPNRIQQLTDKYRNYLPSWLTLTHKYITLYPLPTGNADYNRDYATIYTDEPVFEEVNWSAVDYPEERPDEYRFSRRLSNMYHYTDDPNYKFPDVDTTIEEEELKWTFNEETGEYEQVPRTMVYKADAAGIIDRYDQSTSFRLATFNHNDDIRKIFFLEIVWGYSGWEWHDYDLVIGTDPDTEEPIVETLKGGNLYKIKEIETVPHIIDGFRLYHINDFLNSQNKVTTIEEFDVSNLKAINRAFKRLTRKYGLNTITPLLLKVYEFPEVVEANDAFCNNKISVVGNNAILLPKLVNVDGLYKWGEYTGDFDENTNLKFQLDNLESFTNGFNFAYFSQPVFNLNSVLVGNSLKKVNNLTGLLELALFYNGEEKTGYDKPVTTITVDLSGSSLSSSDDFNLSRLTYWSGTRATFGSGAALPLDDRYFIFNITLKGNTDLSYAFGRIMYNGRGDSIGQIIPGQYYMHSGPNQIEVNFNNTEQLIRSLDYAFTENTFIEQPPIIEWINNYTTENYIYNGCVFNDGITYDFSPNHILNPSQGQFNNCTIDTTKTINFDNVDALKRVRFQNIKFKNGNAISFPFNGDLCNFQDYQYNDDPTNLYRFINFSGSMFTGLKANQTIYATDSSAASMFSGCTNIDFDGDNITIKISTSNTNKTWTIFNNCSSMTRTPKLEAPNIVMNGNLRDNVRDMFLGCANLEYIDAEQFGGTIQVAIPYNVILSDCPNLVYLKMGNVGGFNLTGCNNLDITELNNTLLRQTKLGTVPPSSVPDREKNMGLIIQRHIWEALPSTTQAYCRGLGTNCIGIVEDN